MGNPIDTRSPHLQEDDELHELSRTLREGNSAMRRAAKNWRFVKPNVGELDPVVLTADGEGVPKDRQTFTVYDLRIERAAVENLFAAGVAGTARLPFRRQIQLDGWSPALQGRRVDETRDDARREGGWVDDIDGTRCDLDHFALLQFEEALFEGIAFAFVDAPAREFPDPASRRAAGVRPYAIPLTRSQMYRVIVDSEGPGGPRLRQIAFAQPRKVLDLSDPLDWTEEIQPGIKIIDAPIFAADGSMVEPVRAVTYYQNLKSGDWEADGPPREIRAENPTLALTEIPLVPFYAIRTAPWRGRSPYLDAADLQGTAWVQMSELLNRAREQALSWLHESGVDAGTGEPGGSLSPLEDTRGLRYRWTTEPNGRLTVAELGAGQLAELRETVDWLLEGVARATRSLTSTDRVARPITATEIAVEGVRAASELEMMVILQEAAWTQMLRYMSLLGGLEPLDGKAQIAHDFGLPSSSMDRLHGLYVAGRMTAVNFWREALRHGDVGDGFDLAAEVAADEDDRRTGLFGTIAPGGIFDEDDGDGRPVPGPETPRGPNTNPPRR